MQNIAITAGLRTPITGRSRALANYGVEELAAMVMAELETTTGQRPVGVVLGNCTGPGGNLGRNTALAAGFGAECIGWGIDAQCGSGLVAVQQAMHHVAATGATMFAGGAESASTAPTRSHHGVPFARARFAPQGFPDPDMIEAADELARLKGISRESQESFAERSHELSLGAKSFLRAETVSVARGPARTTIIDDGPRRLGNNALRRFSPVCDKPGATVTPGTTARISDGAAGVVVTTLGRVTGPHWKILASTTTGGDPALPGIVPVASTRQALNRAGLRIDDLQAIEVVEAFAAQSLAVLDGLGIAHHGEIDPRVNTWGGALALGHPWGASGAVGLVRLLHRLRHEGPGSRGLTTCAIGGGMGATMILEYVE
ncbi:thiolase family protein [Rothia uropygialis]|uniref:thiolase family protein n=1 Tax=Kocuria sp. 36 TaxID=1415402 RepID=UPI00101DD3BC|nr:thiolase family protein [Kocuria sp. 36]